MKSIASETNTTETNTTETNMTTLFEDFQDFRDAALSHTGGYVIAGDSPIRLKLGFICAKCGESWQIRLSDVSRGTNYETLLALRDDVQSLPYDRDFVAEYNRRGVLCADFADAHVCPETYTTKSLLVSDDVHKAQFGRICLGCESNFTVPFSGEITFQTETLDDRNAKRNDRNAKRNDEAVI